VRRGAALAAALVLFACGGAAHKPGTHAPAEEHPIATAGDGLLADLPSGADALVELDLRRVRENAVVGPAFALAAPRLREAVPTQLSIDWLRDADVVVAGVYDLAGAQPVTLVLVRGKFAAADVAAASPNTVAIDDRTVAFGPPEWRAAAQSAAAGETPALAADAAFRALRDRAMPARAPGAALRVTARLSKDARISAANQLGVDQVPATISLWGDVADDLAIVALMDGDDAEAATALTGAVQRGVRQLGRIAPSWKPLLDKVTAEPRGPEVRVLFYLGPNALREALAATESD
jgi:hypothetical protein